MTSIDSGSISIGSGNETVVVNNTGTVVQVSIRTSAGLVPIAFKWSPPAVPGFDGAVVERPIELSNIQDKLATARSRGRGRVSVAIHGMGGMGKTSLARMVALQTQADYANGVIWAEVGEGTRLSEADRKTGALAPGVQAKLNEWGWLGLGYNGAPNEEFQKVRFAPADVRRILTQRPRFLVVLDNVWDYDAIVPLLNALPNEAALIVTTRNEGIARKFADTHDVSRLNDDDALALARLRGYADWQPQPGEETLKWHMLLKAVERHPLALDVVLGRIALESDSARAFGRAVVRAAAKVDAAVRSGEGLEELLTDEDQATRSVSASFGFSYDLLDDVAKARFRALGAFAPNADFYASHAAGVWACEVGEAQEQLSLYRKLRLVDFGADGESDDDYRQHALMRGYALARLDKEGERAAASEKHARTYAAAMGAADADQTIHTMRTSQPQLRHAFDWALESDLALALDLTTATYNLFAAFGDTVREGMDWAARVLATARRASYPEQVAAALIAWGIGLSGAATQPGPGETRAQLLHQSLAAYDGALEYYRPDTAPLGYAATQNNRATLLSEIATLPGEDRRGRLLAALEAYDRVLEHHRPDTAPLAYAMTQGNLLNLFRDIAELPDEDTRNWQRKACRAGWEAISGFRQAQHAQYEGMATGLLHGLRTACGSDFPAIWAEAGLGKVPKWLAMEAQPGQVP